jgi:hypothetical protein
LRRTFSVFRGTLILLSSTCAVGSFNSHAKIVVSLIPKFCLWACFLYRPLVPLCVVGSFLSYAGVVASLIPESVGAGFFDNPSFSWSSIIVNVTIHATFILPRSLSDIHIDDSEEGSSQLKVPSIAVQLFVEGNWVLPCTFLFITVGWAGLQQMFASHRCYTTCTHFGLPNF